MEKPNPKCGLCGEQFNSDQELREHERTVHCAEVREKKQQVPALDEEETVA